MAYSSDIPQITNQLPFTINLPEVKADKIFKQELEHILRYISSSLNQKEAALYTLTEQGSNQQYYIQNNTGQFRNVYRLTMNLLVSFGAIAGGVTITPTPHGIVGVQQSAGITANCTDSMNNIFTVVYPNVYIDKTYVYFKNPSTFALTQADVVINCLKMTQYQ